MKVTPRFGLDLTTSIAHLLIENENQVRSQESIVLLKGEKLYRICAVEFPSGCEHATFWVVGEQFHNRLADGIVRPDIFTADKLLVVESTIPKSWKLAISHYADGTRTIIGPEPLIEKGFLERLTDNDVEAGKSFLDALNTT